MLAICKVDRKCISYKQCVPIRSYIALCLPLPSNKSRLIAGYKMGGGEHEVPGDERGSLANKLVT